MMQARMPIEPIEPDEPAAPTPIEEKYLALGGAGGFLGAPTIARETSTPDVQGRYRHYAHGSIYWTARTGAHEIHGYIGSKWAEMGWERSFLGYPITDELPTSDGGGCYNLFEHGLIYWTANDGAKVAHKPIRNISLVKEASRPEVYFICGGVKLWIPSPADFAAVGFRWESIQVVPDDALDAYRPHLFSAPPTIKPSDVFFDCGPDIDFPLSLVGKYYRNCQNSDNLVRKDVVLAGWLVPERESQEMPFINQKPHGVEDVHYNFKLDPEFVDRMYGPGGLSSALNDAVFPGNPFVPNNPLPLRDLAPDGRSRSITYNSFMLVHTDYDIHGELNAWHVNDTGEIMHSHFSGRGPAPAGWRRISFAVDADAWWPFDIMNPDSGQRRLLAGDYVIVKGALWQDHVHAKTWKEVLADPWNQGHTRGHAGWTELHPVDWVVRVDEPRPLQRKTSARLAELRPPDTTEPPLALDIAPDFSPSPVTRQYTVGEIRTLIDGRFSDMTTVASHIVEDKGDHVEVRASFQAVPDVQKRFKASYIVSWREKDVLDVIWVDDALPAGAIMAGDGEGWHWITSNPRPNSGTQAHQSQQLMGIHQHYFYGATEPLVVNSGDTLIAYVHLDPIATPYEVMLQWNDGTWEHRAYWGANLIDWGQDGTASRRYMGPITTVGDWLRLEAPASEVGLVGSAVTGMAFTLFGGRATWDCAGKCQPSPFL